MYQTASHLRLSSCVRHCAFALMIIIILLSITTGVGAQNPEWIVYNTGNAELPDITVYDLALDAQGTLWIGTGEFWGSGSGGVAKFDGETWTVYSTENSELPDNHIIGLALDVQGNIWVGTTIGGAAQFDGETWTVYNQMTSGLPAYDVSALAFDDKGTLWVSTGRSAMACGVAKFDGETWTVYNTKNSGLPSDNVHDLTIDAQGNIWMGTEKGLAKFDRETWATYTMENSGLPSSWIWTIVIDTQGNTWIGMSAGGLAVYREGGVMLPAQKTDPESVLRSLFDALNVKDVDGALAFVADDAVITIIEAPNQFKSNGKEEIRGWWEHVVMDNTITEVSDFQVDGDKASWFARVWIDPWRALEVAPINFSCEGIVQDGLVKSYTLIMTDESQARLQIAANKEIARRWVEEIWNKGDLSVIDEIVASDYVDRSPAPGQETDREAITFKVTWFRTAFPDAHFAITDMIAEGDKVVVPQTFTGTHQGEFSGAPATGNQVTWTGIFIYRIKDGKIVERWGALDTMGFMIQIGAVPPPGEGGK